MRPLSESRRWGLGLGKHGDRALRFWEGCIRSEAKMKHASQGDELRLACVAFPDHASLATLRTEHQLFTMNLFF
ncbi:hypothetical protein R69746_07335 [Paraburkholderia aspalathi]|nr:hypothetical protein R69746_07335 [Paraburkholderia aspalathi]CAE6871709.1 hypothetical protein R75465_08322 [Paraburkholderia aspalathi]